MIGVVLTRVGVNWAGGGAATADFGAAGYLLIAALVLGVILWVAKYKSGGDRSLKQTAAMWPPRVTVKRGWNS
jgi:xanthine/uracil permease